MDYDGKAFQLTERESLTPMTMPSSSGRPSSRENGLSSLITPCSLTGKPLSFQVPRFPSPIPYPYLSPSPSPVRVFLSTRCEVVDILGELFLNGPLEMATCILSYLTPTDLFRCLFVCKVWYQLVSRDESHMVMIAAHMKKCASRKRQHSKVASSLLTHNRLPRPLLRQPLSTIGLNVQSLTPRNPNPSVSHTTASLPTSIKLHTCPNCKSPAREIHLRRAQCVKCQFDFCKKCFRHYHDEGCKSRQDLWGDDAESGPSSIHIAGKFKSETVRKRLKRL